MKAKIVDEGNEWNEKTVTVVKEVAPLLKSLYGGCDSAEG